MKKIGLFYAPAQGSTEQIAKKVAARLGDDNVELLLIDENTEITKLDDFDNLIFGISTVGRDNWDANYTKIGWDLFLPKLQNANIGDKKVAIFGLGNHILYPDNFVDSMGILGNTIESSKANLVGKVSIEGYDYKDSEAVVDDLFFGLPIDEDNDDDLTDSRLENWVNALKSEFGL